MSPNGRYEPLRQRLARIEAAGLDRQLHPLQPTGPTTARDIHGQALDVFSSNDYLGLASHPDVVQAWKDGAHFGTGSARLIAGDRTSHHALEEALEESLGPLLESILSIVQEQGAEHHQLRIQCAFAIRFLSSNAPQRLVKVREGTFFVLVRSQNQK